MRTVNLTFYCFLIALIITPITSLTASPSLSLKGISAVAVRIDHLPEFAKSDGVSEIALKQSAEQQLAEARIKVVEYKDWEKTLGGSYLYIKIVPSRSYSGQKYVIYTEIELYQSVILIKAQIEQNKIIHGNTWSAGILMNCDSISVNTCLLNSLNQLVDIFIKDYKKVN